MQKSKVPACRPGRKSQNHNPKFKNFGLWIVILIFGIYILNFFGCATAPYVTAPAPEGIPGIYHRVEKGQTLWRISKVYDVDLDEVVRINRISDATNIEVGQLIFIPHRQRQQRLPLESSPEDFIWPLKGRVILPFGQAANNMINKGINIQAYRDADVVAARSGRVIFYSPNLEGFGKTIIIDHGDNFLTVYARNAQVFVKPEDFIQKGTRIAKVGSAGRDKNAYLHFQIRKGYTPKNPYFYLP